MCGKACGWGPIGVLHPLGRRIALSDVAVWRFWRLAPTAVELAVRRVKWYQRWIRTPEQNRQIISIMFGTARFESDHFPTLDAEGRICDTAHRFAHQFGNDVKLVSDFPGMVDFKADYAESVAKLFWYRVGAGRVFSLRRHDN